MTIEERVRQIAHVKGIKMSELAKRVGITQSNLIVSIRKNPRISTLEDIALALSVRVADIVDVQKSKTEGLVIIEGKTYTLSKPMPDIVQVPVYNYYPTLKADIDKFILSAVNGNNDMSICGYVETMEFFNLSYNAEDKVFILTLCYGKGTIETYRYDIYSYGDGDKWDISSLNKIYNDIEGHVPFEQEQKDNITQEDVDRAAEGK